MSDRIKLGFNSNNKRRKNFAVGEFSINGRNGRLSALSGKYSPVGTASIPSNRQFTTTFVRGTDRAFDTEVKILETLASKLNRNSEGSIRLLSELKVCPSCSGVIRQFEKAFPRVKVITETGPYTKKPRFSK